MTRTYICGTCGSHFKVTDANPVGCPVCCSQHITAVCNRLTAEDSIRLNLETVKEYGKQIAELENKKKDLMNTYSKARQILCTFKHSGRYVGEIPTYKDFM